MKPLADRIAFGSTALHEYLHLHPEGFELNHHKESGREDDIRVVYFNINGLNGFKRAELFASISSSSVDCLVLIGARDSKLRARHHHRKTRAELGPGAICLDSSPSSTSTSTNGTDSVKVGGNISSSSMIAGPFQIRPI